MTQQEKSEKLEIAELSLKYAVESGKPDIVETAKKIKEYLEGAIS